MNILYILPEKPVTMAYGALQRTNLLWDALRELGDVYAVYFDTNPQSQHIDERLAAIGTMPRVGGMRNFFYRIQNRLPHDLRLLEFGPLKPWIDTSIEEMYPGIEFDVVVCRYIYNYALYHIWDLNLPTFIDIDDHPLQLFDTFFANAVTPCLRPLARKALEWQMSYLEDKVQGIWVSNASNIGLFNDTTKVRWLMNIPLPANSTYVRATVPKPYLLTVGAMNYYPNHHGVTRFLSDIWPLFHIQYPEMEYFITGKDAPPSMIEQCERTAGVKYLGYVPDFDNLYAHCTASIVPINEGSGTCIKTLESVARHVPCITTDFGARGISDICRSMKSIAMFLYNDANEFLSAFDEAAHTHVDASLISEMDKFIAENYSYKHFMATVRESIEAIIRS